MKLIVEISDETVRQYLTNAAQPKRILVDRIHWAILAELRAHASCGSQVITVSEVKSHE